MPWASYPRAGADSWAVTDDTGIRVLDQDHEKGIKRGHLWAYLRDVLPELARRGAQADVEDLLPHQWLARQKAQAAAAA